MEDHDVTNFSTSSSSHRLPTVSASAALEEATTLTASPIKTGLPFLDQWLTPGDAYGSSNHGGEQKTEVGLQRGVVTEIYGPPGSGKTALAMQVASNALVQDDNAQACWIDTASPIPTTRLQQILELRLSILSDDEPPPPPSSSLQPPTGSLSKTRTPQDVASVLSRFHHLHLFTVPHLLALLHPCRGFPPPSTAVIVIDNISSLLNAAFPSHSVPTHRTASTFAKKRAVVSTISTGLAKIAKFNNIAVIVINQTATTTRNAPGGGRRAGPLGLRPGVGGNEWNIGVGTRCVIYREFFSSDAWLIEENRERKSSRWIEVIKGGRKAEEGTRRRAAIQISDAGVDQLTFQNPQDLRSDAVTPSIATISVQATAYATAKSPPVTRVTDGQVSHQPNDRKRKRKRKATDLEIADSQSSTSASTEPDELPSRQGELALADGPEIRLGESKATDDADEYGSFLIGEEDFDFDFESDGGAVEDDGADEGNEHDSEKEP